MTKWKLTRNSNPWSSRRKRKTKNFIQNRTNWFIYEWNVLSARFQSFSIIQFLDFSGGTRVGVHGLSSGWVSVSHCGELKLKEKLLLSVSLEKFNVFHLHIIEIKCEIRTFGNYAKRVSSKRCNLKLQGSSITLKRIQSQCVFHHYFNECSDKSNLFLH